MHTFSWYLPKERESDCVHGWSAVWQSTTLWEDRHCEQENLCGGSELPKGRIIMVIPIICAIISVVFISYLLFKLFKMKPINDILGNEDLHKFSIGHPHPVMDKINELKVKAISFENNIKILREFLKMPAPSNPERWSVSRKNLKNVVEDASRVHKELCCMIDTYIESNEFLTRNNIPVKQDSHLIEQLEQLTSIHQMLDKKAAQLEHIVHITTMVFLTKETKAQPT
jgi:hypothetical protein